MMTDKVKILCTENLSKVYKDTNRGIRNISFCLYEREILGLIGANGAGKTTILKCLAKQLKADSGSIKFKGVNILNEVNSLKTVGVLIETVFYDHLTVKENIDFYLGLHEYNIDRNELSDLLNLVGLKNKHEEKISSLSYGMRQRLSLCICLIAKPELIILDEPFVGLDKNGILALKKTLKSYTIKYGTSIIISSHRLGEISNMCDRVLSMAEGNIIFDGSINEIYIKKIILDRNYVEEETELNLTYKENIVMTYENGETFNRIINELVRKYKILDVFTEMDILNKNNDEGD